MLFDQFYYEILVFNTNFSESYDQLSIDYGPINLVKKDPIFIEYLKHKKTKFLTILETNPNKHILNKYMKSTKYYLKYATKLMLVAFMASLIFYFSSANGHKSTLHSSYIINVFCQF